MGSFVLHEPLHYDAVRVPVVAYFVERSVYLFHKTGEMAGTAVKYKSTSEGLWAIKELERANVGGYYIFDVTKDHRVVVGLPRRRWGGVVLTTPDARNYEGWKKQRNAFNIFVNGYDAREMRAFFAWQERDLLRDSQGSREGRAELEERWQRMKDRICVVGPLPRYVFDEDHYSGRCAAIDWALSNTSEICWEHCARLLFGKAEWGEDRIADKLIKLVRVLRRSAW
ncbi:retrotransposon hot spot (RHS) protein [Trypanosoma rangeli]|uniref:Retrotransposon hot spot (RHS) protein n=1 Tax=Trypanosoma rangeli TaxID=5698 RepID=A0A3R7NX57_TRYRA|nr:retrotransposon hot spot (RHS) protein [Trypanosoma rangeli]RNF09069.1 retrotransposon hot spot (RHS) protein [Trypanosoma rangeli]|eukprot:RNF09069.1 retrotransposon hot spot (RHS) protein [Trypanosoma rangeli]